MDGKDKMLLDELLKESNRRRSAIFGAHNQYTGYNMELHTNRCIIADMGDLQKQYLTDEVYNNGLYQAVMSAGSIRAFVDEINEANSNDPTMDPLTFDLVYDMLVLTRIRRDPSFAFYCLFQITYKKGGVGPFELNYAQRYVLSELESMRIAGKPIRFILLKARQWGGSTLVQLYMAWIQLFVCEQWNSIIIAQVKDTAKVIRAMYSKVLENFPHIIFKTALEFRPFEKSQDEYIITDTRGKVIRDVRIGIGSYEKFAGLRGHPYHLAHFSEVAYWKTTAGKSAEEVVTNINGGFDDIANTLIGMESTPCGNTGLFYDQYQMAKNPEIETLYKALFVPFFYIERDMRFFESEKERREFARNIIANRHQKDAPDKAHEPGEYIWSLWQKGATLEHIYWYVTKRSTFTDFAQMASEAPSDDQECFTYSGRRIFSIKLIESMREKYARKPAWIGDIIYRGELPPHLTENVHGEFRIWHKPDNIEATNRYFVIVDPGGRNKATSDPNVITVIDRLPLLFKGGKPEVVARWRGWIRYDDLAYKAVAVAQYYNNAKLIFESNTFDKKKAQAQEFTDDEDHTEGVLNILRDVYKNLYMRKATSKEDIRNGILTKVGFQTNHTTKQDMVDNFTVVFEDDEFIDPDDRFYEEASVYEKKDDGNWGNMEGKYSNGEKRHDDILMTDMIGMLISRDTDAPSRRQKTVVRDVADYGTHNESDF